MSNDAVGNYLNLLFCVLMTVVSLLGIFFVILLCWTAVEIQKDKW